MLALKVCRLVFIIFSCGVIGFSPDSSSAFFRTMFVFSAGFVYDYWSVLVMAYDKKNISNYPKVIGWIGISFSIMVFIFSIFGLFNAFYLDFAQEGIFVRVNGDFNFISSNLKLNFMLILYTLLCYPILAALEIFNKQDRAKFIMSEQNVTA